MEQLTEQYEHVQHPLLARGALGDGTAAVLDGVAAVERERGLRRALTRERCRREALERGLDALADRAAELEAENLRLRQVL